MKYIKLLENFHESEYYISQTCKEYNIKNYKINKDYSIDVVGDVILHRSKLKELPLKFNIVEGNFNCSNNLLTSLKGSPKKVYGNFSCFNNSNLKSLEYSPNYVSGSFNCNSCDITSLKGSPEKVEGEFNIALNPNITSLEGSPIIVGKFHSSVNNLTSLIGAPKFVKTSFSVDANYIYDIIGFNCEIGGWFGAVKRLSLIYDLLKDNLDDINEFYNFGILSNLKDEKPTLNLKRMQKFIELYDIKTLDGEYYNSLNMTFNIV